MLARPLLLALNPLVWQSKRAAAKKLLSFARTELSSSITLQLAAAQTTSAERRAKYLRHASDERRHAWLFYERSREFCDLHQPLVVDGEDLFKLLGEVKFLAFVHHGEARGRRQFQTYLKWFEAKGDAQTTQIFHAIIADEIFHERYSLELLEQCTSEPKAVLARVRRWELWRTWLRLGEGVASQLYTILMLSLVPLLLPYALLLRLLRPQASSWSKSRKGSER